MGAGGVDMKKRMSAAPYLLRFFGQTRLEGWKEMGLLDQRHRKCR